MDADGRLLGLSRKALALILVALVVAPATYIPAHSDDECSFDVDYRMAVILVGIPGDIVGSVEDRATPWIEETSIQGCRVDIRVTPVIVDGSHLEDYLRSYLNRTYEDLGVPWWVQEAPGGRPIYWVELTSFYRELYGATRSLLSQLNVTVFDTVVIIGDLDGVSRQYYSSRGYPYTGNGSVSIEGVRGWSGPFPLTFYDLTTIPRPRPEPDMPFYGIGEPVGPDTDPTIWEMGGSYAPYYIWDLVVSHVKYHIANVPLTGYTPLKIIYNVTVVSFGDRGLDNYIVSMVGPRETIMLTKTMVPWALVDVRISIVDAGRIPGLVEYVESIEPGPDGFIELDYYRISSILSRWAPSGDGFPTFTYTFFILATPTPSRMTFGEIKFTAFSAGSWGASSWPGHGLRILKSGVPKTLAHEVGHSLGLGHPFEYQDPGGGRFLKWIMDWEASVMSYDNGAIAGFQGLGPYAPNVYEAFRLAISYIIGVYRQLGSLGDAAPLMEMVVEDPVEAARRASLEYVASIGGGGGGLEDGARSIVVPIAIVSAASLFLVRRRT